ncbi:MAG: polysaccharide deacetylase family protein [Firmicutes bacterium]|jgi:probable sporulation protein (polysaccharide deacetylase family)|nr:polysaccharide deacetylase family protein [Bacillota bacterium]MDH7495634.1 polysaccharide deacetylase family protein [Bacillota bacterium]
MRKEKDRLVPKREARLTAIVISKETMLLAAFALLVMVFTAVFVSSLDEVRRVFYGVRPGVTLGGRRVSGLLAHEVRRIVEAMAERERISPKDAMYFKETGEVIAEEPGTDVDVDLTVTRVMKAKPGEAVELATITVMPTITRRLFNPVYKAETDQKVMALAVNVAWGEEHLPAMLETLRALNVKATFFLDGEWAQKRPESVKLLAGEGHEIANHGARHAHVARMPESDIRDLILRNEELLERLGVKPSKLFAPPYGECNQTVTAAAASLGYTTIMWTVDTIDWNTSDPRKVVERVVRKMTPGAIVLMHPTDVSNKALPELVETARKNGYQFATISELLGKR